MYKLELLETNTDFARIEMIWTELCLGIRRVVKINQLINVSKD